MNEKSNYPEIPDSSKDGPAQDRPPPSVDQTSLDPVDEVRDMAGETVMGMRVAAWRWVSPHGEKYGHAYAEHWSTPAKHETVERLFTEADVRALRSKLDLAHKAL